MPRDVPVPTLRDRRERHYANRTNAHDRVREKVVPIIGEHCVQRPEEYQALSEIVCETGSRKLISCKKVRSTIDKSYVACPDISCSPLRDRHREHTARRTVEFHFRLARRDSRRRPRTRSDSNLLIVNRRGDCRHGDSCESQLFELVELDENNLR